MVAFITGASDGIGKETAILLAKHGYKVYGVSRTPGEYDYMEHFSADVSDPGSIKKAVDMVYQKEGFIDILVLCAGTTLASPADLTNPEDSRYLFDVNYWGCVNTISLILNQMKMKKKGRIIIVSSMTGLLPVPYLSFYSSSKAALLSYACALNAEAKPFHVAVTALLPGGVRTQFTDKRKKYQEFYNDPRTPGLKKAIDVLGNEEQTGLCPQEVASKILMLLKQKNPAVVVPVGGIYRFYTILIRILPHRLLLSILRKKYSV